MDSVRSRSESPFTRSKAKEHENGVENGKNKKMMKLKQRIYLNDTDSEDSRASEKGDAERTDGKPDTNESETKITNGNNIENGHQDIEEVANNNGLMNDCESQDVTNGDYAHADENGAAEEEIATTETSEIIVEEEPIISETENCAKNDTPVEGSSENGEALEKDKEANGETDIFMQEEEVGEVGSTVKSASEQTSPNGSENGSHYEDAHSTKDDAQLTLDGTSLSSKLSSFWGKWNQPPPEENKEPEKVIINHPYLGKISGRRGIKEKLNSSATVLEVRNEGRRTPENSEINLDDSFRVRTNPPRFDSSGIFENPTLKKYKGKRCLNASDEPEEDDEGTLGSTKRRKLEKTEESGLLSSLLWTPFKKKPTDNENESKLTAAESKISRFLSPFWFWKKLAAGQK